MTYHCPESTGTTDLNGSTTPDWLTTTPTIEIPMALADKWDQMLQQKGHSATFWEIALWGYEQAAKKQEVAS